MATNKKDIIYLPLEDVESEHCALIVEDKTAVAFIPKRLRTIEPLARFDAEITRKVKLSVGPTSLFIK